MRKCIYFEDEIQQIETKDTYWLNIDTNINDTVSFLNNIYKNIGYDKDAFNGSWNAFKDDLCSLDCSLDELEKGFDRVVLLHKTRLTLDDINDLSIYLEILITIIQIYENHFKEYQSEGNDIWLNHFIIVFNREDWDYYYNEILVKNMSAAELKIIKQVL